MPPDSVTLPEAEHYVCQFSEKSSTLPGDGLTWLRKKRQSAMRRFGDSGFPSTREEDWKYTSLRPITGKKFSLVEDKAQSLTEFQQIPELNSHQLVFLDGQFVSEPIKDQIKDEIKDQKSGMQIMTLAQCLNDSPQLIERHFGAVLGDEGHGLTQLNSGLHQDGVVIVIADNATIKTPIEIVYIGKKEQSLTQPRSLIIAGKNCKAQIIERHLSGEQGATLCNGVTEFIIQENAELDYYLIQTASGKSYQVNGIWAEQHKDSRFNCLTFTVGGALTRNDIRARLCESGAHCEMLGIYSLTGKQHADNHTTIEHVAPGCSSKELYKGVLNQKSRGVFHGRIKVHKDAQQTDAQQSNNTLILSRDAEIDTKPQLEIYADDVKCSHGATIGQLDQDALFYLRSRGIEESDARSMLTHAFALEVLEQVRIDPLKNYLDGLLADNPTA